MNHTMRLALALAVMLLVTCAGLGYCAPVTGVGLSDVLANLRNDTPNVPVWSPGQLGLTGSSVDASSAFNARIAEQYGKLPLSFVENRGQLDSAVRYVIRGPLASAFFTDTGVTFDLSEPLPKDTLFRDFGHARSGKPNHSSIRSGEPGIVRAQNPETTTRKCAALRMEFEGADPNCRVEGIDELPGKVNYFTGSDSAKWHTDIPTFKGVIYRGVWPGVDVSYHGDRRQLKYDIRVAPGADLSQIRLRYEGAENLWLDDSGDLHLRTAVTTFVEKVPGIYQENGGEKQALRGGYVLLDDHTVGFRLEGRNPDLPLVIDPASDLVYSTFLGGSGEECGAIAIDSSGCAYVAGGTSSSDFPTTPGAFQRTYGGGYYDAFVTKLNASGSALVYSTFLGGSYRDGAGSIAIDSSGCVYVEGQTDSSNFPTSTGAFQRTYGGGGDAFVTKLNATGSALVYSTFLGGSYGDGADSIAIDSSGCAYVAGQACSSNFPTTPGAFQRTIGSYDDAFVTKLNASGSALVYSTYLGGSDGEWANSIAIDSSDCAYVAGSTWSSDFPTTPGAFQRTFRAAWNGFVTKLNASGSKLVYSTYLNGNDGSWPAITVDSSGCAYVAGVTASSDFPTTSGAFQSTLRAARNGFVTKLNADGSALVYSTYLGGSGYCEWGDCYGDEAYSIAVDSSGCAYVAGWTGSSDFPTTPGAFDRTHGGGWEDGFIAKLRTGSPPPPPGAGGGWYPPDGTVLDVRNPYADYTVAQRVKGQLHCHYFNDAASIIHPPWYVQWGVGLIGSWKPEGLLTAYAALGYDFVCITEHNHCTTQPLIFQSRFVSNCEEATMSFAHVLTIGTNKTGCATRTDELRNYPWDSFNQLCEVVDAAPNDLKEAVNRIHSPAYGNGLAIVAHPNAGCIVSADDIREAKPDAIAVLTAGCFSYATDKWDNLLKSGVFLRHISEKKMLLYGASEDDFTPPILPWAFGRTWVVAELEETTANQASFIKALRNGRYWAYGSLLKNIGPGPVLQLTTSQNADGKVVISVTSSASTEAIQFIGMRKDEGVKVLSKGSGTAAEYICSGSELYVRVEVWAGNVIAWSQPIALAWNYSSDQSAAQALSMLSSQSVSPASTPADIVFACALPEQLPDAMPPQGYIGRAYFVSTTSGFYAPDATFILSYEGQDVTPYGTSNLAIFRWDAIDTQWVKLTGTVDSGNALVTAPLTQEGLYTISAEIIGDATAPTVTIYTPSNGAVLTGQSVISMQVTDNVGVLKTSFYLGDLCIGVDSTSYDGYTCEYDFGKKAAGQYTLKVEAEDVSGNRGSAEVTVNIASSGVAPVLTMTAPENGADLTGTVTVSGTCADNTLVTGVFVIADGIPVGEAAITGGNWSFDLDTTKLADGPHSLSAMVMDDDQNTSEQAVNVTVSGATLASISAARQLDDGQRARIAGRVVTLGDPGYDGGFYIEELSRLSGIRVEGSRVPAQGDLVSVSGLMSTEEGERAIVGADVLTASSGNPVPVTLGFTDVALGGMDVYGGHGLSSIGLLVRVWGKVTQIGDGYLYLDDGRGLIDGTLTGATANVGVRIICDPAGRTSGQCLVITGVSSCFATPSGHIARRVITRTPADITLFP